METIHIDHVDTVQVQDSSAVPLLEAILAVLQDMQLRLAALADQQEAPQP